jgi:hypothetical protein
VLSVIQQGILSLFPSIGVALAVFFSVSEKLQKQQFASSCLSVSPPVRMEQLGSHGKDFHEI